MKNNVARLTVVILSLLPLTLVATPNEATEPSVEGPAAIDLLASGNLDAWTVPSDHWQFENGAIVANTHGQKLDLPEWIYTKRSFGDFEFTCELRLSGDDRRNSGIYYRAKIFRFDGYKTFDAPAGYELDAGKPRPNRNNYWGSLGDWYSRPKLRIFADQEILKQAYQPEDWNRLTIRARDKRLEYWINGIKVMDYHDPDPNRSREGVIGFQIHDKTAMKAEYRNIRVRPLSD